MKKHLLTTLALLICFMIFSAPSCQVKPTVCPTDSLPPLPNIALLGDSLMTHNAGYCETVINNLDGLLGRHISSYAVGGAKLSGGTIITIADQYKKAKIANPDLNIIILNGGGNDILFECAGTELPSCVTDINTLISEFDTLFNTMTQTGLVKVIYVGVYKPLGIYTKYGEAVESLNTRIMTTLVPKYRIIFINLIPLFKDHPEYMDIDNLHPSIFGSELIANEIYKVLNQT